MSDLTFHKLHGSEGLGGNTNQIDLVQGLELRNEVIVDESIVFIARVTGEEVDLGGDRTV